MKRLTLLLAGSLVLSACAAPNSVIQKLPPGNQPPGNQPPKEPTPKPVTVKGLFIDYMGTPIPLRNSTPSFETGPIGTLGTQGEVELTLDSTKLDLQNLSHFYNKCKDMKIDAFPPDLSDVQYFVSDRLAYTKEQGVIQTIALREISPMTHNGEQYKETGFWYISKDITLIGSMNCSGNPINVDLTLKEGWNRVYNEYTVKNRVKSDERLTSTGQDLNHPFLWAPIE